jgi:hypothetical protein
VGLAAAGFFAPAVSLIVQALLIWSGRGRAPRSRREWLDEINKIEALLALPSQREKSKIAAVLAKGFDGQPDQASQTYGASAELARAKVREWNARSRSY